MDTARALKIFNQIQDGRLEELMRLRYGLDSDPDGPSIGLFHGRVGNPRTKTNVRSIDGSRKND